MYKSAEATEIQEKVRHYIRNILHEDFKNTDENPLLTGSVFIFISLYNNATNLDVSNETQARLKEKILTDIKAVSTLMQVRSYRSKPEPIYLIYIAAFGFFVSSVLFAVYKPDRISVVFFCLYNAFVAIVLYFIIMLNNIEN
jgi:hypothetical protein